MMLFLLLYIVTIGRSGATSAIRMTVAPMFYHQTGIDLGDPDAPIPLVFSVKACDTAAVIGVQTTYRNTAVGMYEIVIGSDAGGIRKVADGPYQANYTASGLLSCSAYRSFWIEVQSGTIQVGLSLTPGNLSIMNYSDPSPYAARYVAVRTDGDASCAENYTMYSSPTHVGMNEPTPKLHLVGIGYRETNIDLGDPSGAGGLSLILAAKCPPISFGLQQALGDINNMYEFIIGGWSNTLSVLRRGHAKANEVVHKEKNLISCNEYRTFWVTFETGTVRFGKGAVLKKNQIMAYTDPSPHQPRYVAVRARNTLTTEYIFFPKCDDCAKVFWPSGL